MKSAPLGCLFAILLGSSGCAAPPPACGPAETGAVLDTLYFGTDTPQGVVTIEQWKDFLSQVVTPSFPAGLTWWEARGQWRGASGAIQQETARLLQIAHPESRDHERSIRAIMERYRTRFRQEAVLRVRVPTCLSY